VMAIRLWVLVGVERVKQSGKHLHMRKGLALKHARHKDGVPIFLNTPVKSCVNSLFLCVEPFLIWAVADDEHDRGLCRVGVVSHDNYRKGCLLGHPYL
jgi:hypothetical protein